MSYSEWRKVKLKDISTDGRGFYGIGASAVEYNESLYTYLRITDITDNGRINKYGLKSVSDDNAKDYLLRENDIVFARTGNSTGRAYFYDKRDGKFVYAGFLIRFNLDEKKVNPKYIKLYTLTNEYKNWVDSFATGSTRKNINAKMYGNMEIMLPSRKYQNHVVNLIEPLNEKIRINNQINKKLEKIAQSIFKHWFVDFEFPNENGEPYKSSDGEMVESELGLIPKGWEVKSLEDVAILTMGLSPKSSTYNTEGIGKPLLNGAADFEGLAIKPNKYTTDPKRLCNIEDLVFCIRGTIGHVTFADKLYCLGRGVASIIPNEKSYKFLIYFFLNSEIERLTSFASGSVIKGLTKKDIQDIKVIMPTKEIISNFYQISSDIFQKISVVREENERLMAVRDITLPKLMTGKIRVSLDEEGEVS